METAFDALECYVRCRWSTTSARLERWENIKWLHAVLGVGIQGILAHSLEKENCQGMATGSLVEQFTKRSTVKTGTWTSVFIHYAWMSKLFFPQGQVSAMLLCWTEKLTSHRFNPSRWPGCTMANRLIWYVCSLVEVIVNFLIHPWIHPSLILIFVKISI